MKGCKSHRSCQELSNEYLVAKVGFETTENEPRKVWIADLSDHIVRSHVGGVVLRVQVKYTPKVQSVRRRRCISNEGGARPWKEMYFE